MAGTYETFDTLGEGSEKDRIADSDYKKKSRGCSTTEKSLCAVIVLFTIVCIVLAALLVVQYVLKVGAFRAETCTRPDCVEVAGKILSRMDLGTKPCDNFYQYTCGKWLAELTLPPDKASYSMFTDVSERNVARVRELLASDGNQLVGQDSTAIRKAKDYYKACMDKKSLEDRGIQPMMDLIKELGSWTATSGASGTWDENTWDLFSTIVKTHKSGSSPLFDMSVDVNLRDVDEHILTFDQSGLTFGERDFYLDDSLSKKYKKAFKDYFAAVVVLLGGDNATSYQIAEDIWQLETKIANISMARVDRQDSEKLYHKMTVSDLQSIMGDWINLEDYLQQVVGYRIAGGRDTVVYAPDFLGKIGGIVKNTTTRTMANYLVFHGARGGLSYLPYPFQQASLAFQSALYGVSARPPEWKICIERTSGSIGQASGALFVEKYFSVTDRKRAEDMLDTIKTQFKERIKNLDWMDDETKERALEKVDAIENMIGFPDMARDPSKLDVYYEDMNITDNNVFQNWQNVNAYYVKKNLKKLPEKPDKKEWGMPPNEVNAYYSPTTNSMVFPAGILQYPFYDPTFPMAVNYGAIGMVMGHELTHGFDNSGRQFDKKGNLRNWWEQASLDNFNQKTECIIKQYDQYIVGNKHVNGKLTQGENIADNGGIKTAFAAYHQWLSEHGSEEHDARLPSFNMTETQSFFLGFGQIWCSYATPQSAEQALVTDVHSPAKYRVLGSLNNMQEFSDVFYCRPGTMMNNQEKCVIW